MLLWNKVPEALVKKRSLRSDIIWWQFSIENECRVAFCKWKKLYIYFYMYMKCRVTKRKRETEWETFYPLNHFPNDHKAETGPGQSWEPGTPWTSLMWVSVSQIVESSSTAFPSISEELGQKPSTRSLNRSWDPGCWYSKEAVHQHTPQKVQGIWIPTHAYRENTKWKLERYWHKSRNY